MRAAPGDPRVRGRLGAREHPGVRPPEFLLFSNRPDYVTESYMRYIQNKIRSDLGFEMIPILLKVKIGRAHV